VQKKEERAKSVGETTLPFHHYSAYIYLVTFAHWSVLKTTLYYSGGNLQVKQSLTANRKKLVQVDATVIIVMDSGTRYSILLANSRDILSEKIVNYSSNY
jgi:hypothetical protein